MSPQRDVLVNACASERLRPRRARLPARGGEPGRAEDVENQAQVVAMDQRRQALRTFAKPCTGE